MSEAAVEAVVDPAGNGVMRNRPPGTNVAERGDMAARDRLPRDPSDGEIPDEVTGARESGHPVDRSEEEALRARLGEDPNDVPAFDRLAQIVRTRAAEGHEAGDPQREADDAVWALAEEVAHNGRAWYPLIELGRLSIDDDREVALRRLATAAERDHTGQALAQGLQMLRDAGHAGDALNLGVGHWRPREHVVEAGRQLIEAAIDADRYGEARRHLDALSAHPDQAAVASLRAALEVRIAGHERPSVHQAFEDAGPGASPAGAAPRA
jgi:hypothetical protein